jgi:hypothetical protein
MFSRGKMRSRSVSTARGLSLSVAIRLAVSLISSMSNLSMGLLISFNASLSWQMESPLFSAYIDKATPELLPTKTAGQDRQGNHALVSQSK